MSEIASLAVKIGADISGLNKGLKTAESDMDSFITKASGGLDRFGEKLTGLGGKISLMTVPLAALGIVGINTASQFESAMVEIATRTGATEEQMEAVRAKALQMGADTAFSAQDAAGAFLELLASGQSLEEAMATIEPVMIAAAASSEDLGTVADDVTNIMAMFGLGAEDAGTIVDSLAKAAGASSADMAGLADGFTTGGSVARQYGLSVEQTAAALAVFAENGIKGSEAGTQLKSMLQNMNRTTDDVQGTWDRLSISFYDGAGNARELGDVIRDLDAALDPLPAREQNEIMTALAGSYGILGLNALRNSISIEEMQTKMSEGATAGDVASAKMDTFAGALDSLQGSVETLMIEAFTPFMNDILKPMVETITEIVNQVTTWAAENPELSKTLLAIGSALLIVGPALIGLGLAAGAASIGIGALGTAFAILTSPVTLVILAIAGVVAAILWAWPEIEKGLKAIGDVFDSIFGWINDNVIQPVVTAFNDFVNTINDGLRALGLLPAETKAMTEEALGYWNSYWNNILAEQSAIVSQLDPTVPMPSMAPGQVDGSHAVGLDNVPFDGYVAELHKGETVLGASEARAYRSGRGGGMNGGGAVQIVVNSYGKNPHELIELIKKATKNGAL